MKKIRKLGFFGILGVVIAVLFLISISFTQAQVQTQDKPPWAGPPDKEEPEEATWAVQLPVAGSGWMLYGDGEGIYTNNDGDVRVKVEQMKSRVGKGNIAYSYYFCFKLVNPTGRHVGFQGVAWIQEEYPDEGPFCIFPDGICMETFMNQPQPHPDYEYFYLKFWVAESSLSGGRSLEDMIIGDKDQFTNSSDRIKFRIWNQEDFTYPETEYHNIECDEINRDDDIDFNIWIERLETNKWRIYVGYDPYTGYSLGEDLWVQEQYTKRAEGKGKKGGNKTVTVVPLEAEGNFSFYIDFIKNPPSTN